MSSSGLPDLGKHVYYRLLIHWLCGVYPVLSHSSLMQCQIVGVLDENEWTASVILSISNRVRYPIISIHLVVLEPNEWLILLVAWNLRFSCRRPCQSASPFTCPRRMCVLRIITRELSCGRHGCNDGNLDLHGFTGENQTLLDWGNTSFFLDLLFDFCNL